MNVIDPNTGITIECTPTEYIELCEKCGWLKDTNTEAEKSSEEKLVRNRIRCLKCGDIIESKSVHDYVVCSCGACAVDGGLEYQKISGNAGDWEDLSVWE